VPVRIIAEEAGIPQSLARYALADLIEKKRVAKKPHRNFNKHYCRYSYEVL
jgi:hypothetical protein